MNLLDILLLVPAQTHEGALAFESYLLGTIMGWLTALAIVVLCWKQRLRRYYLFLAGAILARAAFSALLTISAGPAPVFDRAYLADMIRLLNLASNAAMLIWAVYLVNDNVQIAWHWNWPKGGDWPNATVAFLLMLASLLTGHVSAK